MKHAVALGMVMLLAGCAAFLSYEDRITSEYARERAREWRAVTVPLGHVLGGDIWNCQVLANKPSAARAVASLLAGPFLGASVEQEMRRDAIRDCMEMIGWQLDPQPSAERHNWAAPHE